MKTKGVLTRAFISLILITSLLLPGFTSPVFAQERPIVITFGQPNIWSLEQAHYLLARMHRQNLDLQTAPLGTLDPNATNASRIDILKTLLQAGVSYDQAIGLNNELLRRDKVFNSDRRRQLLSNRSTLQTQSTQLARDIAALRISKTSAATEQEKAAIQESIDARTAEKAAVDNELTQTNDELKGLTSATGNFESAEVPEFSAKGITGDLDNLIDKVEFVNPSIAATLRLDNHIQLQYELISKQLTLLRDEVGPGERLVFLELPQSINATQDRAEDKMAQTWWRIAGYTTVDRDWLLLKELKKLLENIKKIETDIKANDDLSTQNQTIKQNLLKQLASLCQEQADLEKDKAEKEKKLKTLESDEDRRGPLYARRVELCKELTRDLEQIAQSIRQTERTISSTQSAIQKVDEQGIKIRETRARLAQAFTSLSTKYEKLRLEQVRNEIRKQQDVADRLWQRGGADTKEVVDDTITLLADRYQFKRSKSAAKASARSFADCAPLMEGKPAENCQPREFVDLEEDPPIKVKKRDSDEEAAPSPPELQRRSVRTIDIVPRQNAINVQDTKQRVSRTGIFAALSFLFGFAGKFTYERQREQAEQFLNQELFTSGFGKGEKDFGWSFFPFAGTKQLSSGVRTTFAVAIIPDDAETLVLKARGCYFPRKDNQPLDWYTASRGKWTDEDRASKALCTPSEQVFVLPVPGSSGDGSDYYVTGIRYSSFQEPGSRMVASIYGQNLPSQVGILIDGVPLRQAVGLGQLNIESILGDDKIRDNCVGNICGRFERIDAHEIVISFQAGANFEGTPRIGLIGPGRSIELNKLFLTVNGDEDVQLESSDAMFGDPPDPNLRRIADFKVAPPAAPAILMTGVLTGSRFQTTDQIFVNGSPATPTSPCRRDLCIVTFAPQETDFLTVTISPADPSHKAVSKTFVNPTNLSIISASVVSYVPETGVLTVKLDGSGFKQDLEVLIIKSVGPPGIPEKIVPSAGQMVLKITQPEAVVQINVRDPANNRIVSTVVVRPEVPKPAK